MTLRLTPDILEAMYEYLRATPPFSGWRLPDPDDVDFQVTRHKNRFSHMRGYQRMVRSEIGISEILVGTSRSLTEAMAHEMTHLYQHVHKTETPNAEHNAQWVRLAKSVCRSHGFDPKTF